MTNKIYERNTSYKFEGGIIMQPLTKVMQGATCTVKWALGLPETVEKLRELKIEQGSKLQVVCKSSDYMIIGVGSKRYAVGNEIAGRIQV